MSNENDHMHLVVVDIESALNQELVAVNQNPVQGVVAEGHVAENVQNPTPPQAQVMIQGPNQVALHHVEVAPPIAAAAAIIEVPNVVLPNLPQPPIPAPELAPVPMVIPPAANDNPIHLRLMRTLYGFPDIQMEEEHGEGEDAQDSDDGGA